MDLATVQSDEDRAKLKEAADAVNCTSDAWIGFYYDVLTWRWSYQNTPLSYKNWESWEPDLNHKQEACVTVNKNGRWGDTSCTELKYFFCLTGKKSHNTFVQLCSAC